MSHNVLILGLLVGAVNFLFRWLPLTLRFRPDALAGQGITSRILDSIGIASICALLVVSGMPDIIAHPSHMLPAAAGLGLLVAAFYQTRSIIFSTLVSAFAYGVMWKLLTLIL